MSNLNQHQTESLQAARFGLIKLLVLAEIALLLSFAVHYLRQGGVNRTIILFFLATAICALPLVTKLFWKAQISKASSHLAKVPVYTLPFTSRAQFFGAKLTVTANGLVWQSKLKAVQEIPFSSVKEMRVVRRDFGDFNTGTVGNAYWLELVTTSISGPIGDNHIVTIGLSQFPKEHWPIVVAAISENSPNAHINELAELIKIGQVPHF